MEEKKLIQSVPSWTWLVLIGLCVFFFFFGVIKSCSKDKDEPEERGKNESLAPQYHWQIERIDTVYFTNEYSEVYRGVEPGTNTSSQNATEPYCVKNKAGEFCMQKNEDMFLIAGNSTNNNELRFKSQNGKTGSIEIVFWVWVKKKK